ncbi:MAG: hypothetical protein ABIH68_02900 [bacterium]
MRNFGITIGIILGLLGVLFLLRKGCYPCFFAFSAVFLLPGLLLPGMLKPVYKIWMFFAGIIKWLTTKIFLFILFYLIITPIRFAAGIFGKKFLDLKFDRKADSYWIPKKVNNPGKNTYEKQF